MGMPRDKDAKRFYRAAGQRLEDSTFLFEAARTTAAVYLAGYCVECLWKALIITQAGKDGREEALALFRGAVAHNYDFLRSLYSKYGGKPAPKRDRDLVSAFVIIGSWQTDLRYDPRTTRVDDAEEFLEAVRRIWKWADERL